MKNEECKGTPTNDLCTHCLRTVLGRSGNGRGDLLLEEPMNKPRIFLASSGKQGKLIQALTRGLEDVAHVAPWTTSFNPGTTTLERLIELTHERDESSLHRNAI